MTLTAQSLGTSIADDMDYFDGVVTTVEYRRRETGAETTLEAALRRDVTTREATASNGKYTTDDTRLHVKQSDLSQPEIGDTWYDTDGTWVVLSVQNQTLLSRWRLISRNLVIACQCDTTIDVETANWTKRRGGSQEPNWTTLQRGIRASKRRLDASEAVEDGKRQMNEQYEFVVDSDFVFGQNHRIKHGRKYYRVIRYQDAERIDTLPRVIAEPTP